MIKFLKSAGVILVLLAALGPAAGCGQTENQTKVVVLGDSLTYGFPLGPKESWVEFASEALHLKFVNFGVPSATTEDLLDRMAKVEAEQPTHLIIFGGTNDALNRVPEEQVEENIKSIGEAAEKQGIKVIVALPIPVSDYAAEQRLSGYRHWMRQYAGQMHWQVVDFYSAVVDKQTGFMQAGFNYDGVHPNLQGYKEMAKAVDYHLFR